MSVAGNPTLTRVDTIVQFTQGSSIVWNDVNVPVPMGAVVIDTVNKIMKEGDGTTLYANLPICLDYNFSHGVAGAIVPTGDNIGDLAIASSSTYSPSSVKLTDILNSITSLNNTSVSQQSRINTLTANNIVASVSPGTANGTIVVCNAGQYVVGTQTLAQLISSLISQGTVVGLSMHITDLAWYTDSGLTQPVATPNDLNDGTTYWCQVTGWHDTAELRTVDFSLATATPGISITNTEGYASCAILTCIYGGTNNETFFGTTTDSLGNIICVGQTQSEGIGQVPFAVKFDTNLNILGRIRYGGSSGGIDQFYQVACDSDNNIICVGVTDAEGTYHEGLVVKFDKDFNILSRKHYGGSNHEWFLGVAVDVSKNIICCGCTQSEGQGGGAWGDALVVKYDSNLNVIAKKIYGGSSDDVFKSVACDSAGNIICVGFTFSEGTNGDALVVKFDLNLNLLVRKYYGGAYQDGFNAVALDSSNNIICVGWTYSESAAGGNSTYQDALVVKFDSNLNILFRKIYGGSYGEAFQGVAVDSSSSIICAGWTNSEGTGFPTYQDALVVRFDSNLNIIAKKHYGGSNVDVFQSVAVDYSGNIICVGNTASAGSGVNDALVLKLPANIPTGSVTGTVLTGLTLSDSSLTLANSALTLANSTLTLATSGLSSSNSGLILANSTLTQKSDTLAVSRQTVPTSFIAAIYKSLTSSSIYDVKIDSSGNIFAVGFTTESGVSLPLICKFDANLNPLVRKTITGYYSGAFQAAAIDSSGNIICAGNYNTQSGGLNDAFIIKFNSGLTSILLQKSYGGSGTDVFFGLCIDPSGNYVAVGYTTSEGLGGTIYGDALIVKFSSTDMSILARQRYGGTADDMLYNVTTDPSGNYIAVGFTQSEGVGNPTYQSGLILKLDSNLTIIARKVYSSTIGTSGMVFYGIVITSANVIYVSARLTHPTLGNKHAVVRFDSSLNVTANNYYSTPAGSSGNIQGISVDSSGNVFVAGNTDSEGASSASTIRDATVMKLSKDLAILGKKTYGGFNSDSTPALALTSSGDVVIAGFCNNLGNGIQNGLVVKLPNSLPLGEYASKNISGMVLADSNVVLYNDNAVVANSALTLAASALTLTTSTFIFGTANAAVVTDTTIMGATPNVFKVAIGSIAQGSVIVPTFSVVTNDGTAQVGKNMTVNIHTNNILECLYGGANNDLFYGVAVDSSNNIICVGKTFSEPNGPTWNGALIIKFDTNLNILARKVYGGAVSADDEFFEAAIDSSGNIYCCGFTNINGSGVTKGLVVKFDSSLNLVYAKYYGTVSGSYFYGIALDSSNNIYCCGKTNAESSAGGNPTYQDALIVKFDTNLNVLAKKIYGGAYDDIFRAVAVDSSNNIICAGWTYSEGSGNPTYQDALVVKFDTNLNILARKIYGGAGNESFQGVAVDSSNNIICVGSTTVSESTTWEGLVVKFDTNLNILARKIYGGANTDSFGGVAADSSNNIICSGYTNSEGAGIPTYNDALVVKFDTSLNVIFKKHYGGTDNDNFTGVTVDSPGNIVCVGYTASIGTTGGSDGIIVKIPPSPLSGTFIGTVLTGLTLSDSNLTLVNSTLALTNSALTLANSGSTTANSILALANSALTRNFDTIIAANVVGITISSIGVYTDAGCTQAATSLNNNTTYYVKVVPVGGGGSKSSDTYTLTTGNANAVPTYVSNGVFSLAIGTATAGTLVLTATATYSSNTSAPAYQNTTLSGQAAITVSSVGVYADAGCTQAVTVIENNTTYYAKVVPAGGGGSQSTNTYSLISDNVNVVLTYVSNGVFSLAAGTVSAGTLNLTATTTFSGNTSATFGRAVTLSGQSQITVSSIGVFSDAGCTIPVTVFNNNLTYYAKVTPSGGGGSQGTDTYSLTTGNANVVPTYTTNGVFSLAVGTAIAGTLVLTATDSYGGNTSAPYTQNVTLSGQAQITVSSIGVYSDAGCTLPVTVINNNKTYYAKVVPAGGGSQATDTYTLTTGNANVTPASVGSGVFSLAVGAATAGTLTLTATASFGGNTSANATQNKTLSGQNQISVSSIGVFSDAGCTLSTTTFDNGVTYYAKVVPAGGGGSQGTDTYGLTTGNPNVVPTYVSNGVFSLAVGTATAGTLTLTATASFGGNTSANATQNVTLSGQFPITVSSVGTYSDAGCTIPVTTFDSIGGYYYAKVVPAGGGGSQSTDTYSLASDNFQVTSAYVSNGVFSLDIAQTTGAGTLTLTATASYGGKTSAPYNKTVALSGHH